MKCVSSKTSGTKWEILCQEHNHSINFEKKDSNTIAFKRLSSDTTFAGTFKFGGTMRSVSDLQVGVYVAVVYDDAWYVGLVEELNAKDQEAFINFMHPKNPDGYISWPNRTDKCLTPINKVLAKIPVPSSTSLASRTYKLSKKEHKSITLSFKEYMQNL